MSQPNLSLPTPKTRPWLVLLAGLLAAIASGLMLALSFPPTDIGPLIWIWPAPLLMYFWWIPRPPGKARLSRLWRGFGTGWVAGLVFFLINVYWIREVHDFGWITLSCYLAIYPGLWGAFCTAVARPDEEKFRPSPTKEVATENPSPVDKHLPKSWRFLKSFAGVGESLRSAFLCAAAWTGTEWLRGVVFTGFGWNGLGVAMHKEGMLLLAQSADIIGAIGLSFPIMFVAATAVNSLRRLILELRAGRMRSRGDFVLALGLIMIMILYGLGRLPQSNPDDPSLTVKIIQTNIPQQVKLDPANSTMIRERLNVLSDGVAPGTELLIWPESSLPDWFDAAENIELIGEVMSRGQFHLLVGADIMEMPAGATEPKAYNSAILVPPVDTAWQIYRKSHLVPFGEYVPLRDFFTKIYPPIGELVPGDFDRGTETEPLTLQGSPITLIPLICFEDTVPRFTRRFIRTGPQLLVNITNDGWFGESIASRQHMNNAIFRCIELRRPMVRAANTGVSTVILSSGRIMTTPGPDGTNEPAIMQDESGNTFVMGTMTREISVPMEGEITVFARWGDFFAVTLLFVALLYAPFQFLWNRFFRHGTKDLKHH